MDADLLARLIKAQPEQRERIYEEGLRFYVDNPFARFQWTQHAAILGIADAVQEVVAAYKEGNGTEPDQRRAFEWMKKGAEELGISSLAFELALAYRDGIGTPHDLDKFWELMGRAARQGDTEAMYELAEAHSKPNLGQLSPERSTEWTTKGAGEGDPAATVKLSRRFQKGDGVKKDLQKFFEWARKAADLAQENWAKACADSHFSGYSYEDYPDALVALADAQRELGHTDQATQTELLAATAAHDAIELAKRKGDTVTVGKSKSLPELMLGRLSEFQTSRGTINRRRQKAYFSWLVTIDEAVQQVYFSEDGEKSIPPGLAQATYELALAYRDAIGTSRSPAKSFEYMARAAKAGHGEAAYQCALKAQHDNNSLSFAEYLAMGASSNDARCRIGQALLDSDLSGVRFRRALDSLAELQECVHQIRRDRHTVSAIEATEGIAHYTDGAGLTSMLGSDTTAARNIVRLYNISYVNDPKEGKRLKSFEPSDFDNPLVDFFKDSEKTTEAISWQGQEFLVFIACFSLRCDQLDLWRFYGKDGTGYSVVSPATSFDADSSQAMFRRSAITGDKTTAPPITLYKVLYEDNDAETALRALWEPLSKISRIRNHSSQKTAEIVRKVAAAIVSELLYLYKDRDYAQEKEVRAVEARILGDPELKQHPNSLEHFAKLFIETRPILFQSQGSAIIIGPKVDKGASIMLDIKHRLEKKGFAECKVALSVCSYR